MLLFQKGRAVQCSSNLSSASASLPVLHFDEHLDLTNSGGREDDVSKEKRRLYRENECKERYGQFNSTRNKKMGQQQQKMEIFNNENSAHNTNNSASLSNSNPKHFINTSNISEPNTADHSHPNNTHNVIQSSAANSYFNSLSTKS